MPACVHFHLLGETYQPKQHSWVNSDALEAYLLDGECVKKWAAGTLSQVHAVHFPSSLLSAEKPWEQELRLLSDIENLQ